jgi:hypothetical protein
MCEIAPSLVDVEEEGLFFGVTYFQQTHLLTKELVLNAISVHINYRNNVRYFSHGEQYERVADLLLHKI